MTPTYEEYFTLLDTINRTRQRIDLDHANMPIAYIASNPIFPESVMNTSAAPLFHVACTWNDWLSGNYTNFVNCSTQVKVFWHPEFYKCFTFQPTTEVSALLVVLDVRNDPIALVRNYLQMMFSLTEAFGVRMLIHPRGTYPYMHDGMSVSPGTEVSVTLGHVKTNFLGPPYENCTRQTHLDPDDDTSPLYTTNGCLSLCKQTLMFQKCGCWNPIEGFTDTMIRKDNSKFCMNASELMSAGNVSSDVINKYSRSTKCYLDSYGTTFGVSQCNCLLPCQLETYETEVATASWPNPAYQYGFYKNMIAPYSVYFNNKYDAYNEVEEALNNGNMTAAWNLINSLNLIQQNFIQVLIEFKEQLVFTSDETAVVTWDTLVSNLGGALSLWLGITFMLVVEIIELLYSLAAVCVPKQGTAPSERPVQCLEPNNGKTSSVDQHTVDGMSAN